MRPSFLLLLILASCASSWTARASEVAPVADRQIEYVSADLRYAASFTATGARFGDPFLALSPVEPSSPTRYFTLGDGIQCASVGPSEDTDEFAIKRPIRDGERYNCLRTSFRVVRCFEGCRAAVIERVSRLSGPSSRGSLTSYMYVHDCRGVLAFSVVEDMTEGIPFEAALLRGEVGILADRNYPNCRH